MAVAPTMCRLFSMALAAALSFWSRSVIAEAADAWRAVNSYVWESVRMPSSAPVADGVVVFRRMDEMVIN